MSYDPVPGATDANKLQGYPVSPEDPADTDVLTWDEDLFEWRPLASTGGGGSGLTGGTSGHVITASGATTIQDSGEGFVWDNASQNLRIGKTDALGAFPPGIAVTGDINLHPSGALIGGGSRIDSDLGLLIVGENGLVLRSASYLGTGDFTPGVIQLEDVSFDESGDDLVIKINGVNAIVDPGYSGVPTYYGDGSNLTGISGVSDGQQLLDSVHELSLDAGTRQAVASDGATVALDWSDPSKLQFFSGLSYVTSGGVFTGDGGGLTNLPVNFDIANTTDILIGTGINRFANPLSSGTGVKSALQVNVGSAGSVIINGGALGTPSSGTVTNLTGTASININGTVGATTPGTGAFTTLSSTGAYTNSKSGAASVSAGAYSGVPFAGTGTTSFPLVYINDANATASTTLNTAGTYFGVNSHGTQDLMNLMVDGVSKTSVNQYGQVSVPITTANDTSTAGAIGNVANNYTIRFNNSVGSIDFTLGGTYARARIAQSGIFVGSDSIFTWYNAANGVSFGSKDTGLGRNAAGVVEVNNGTAGQWGGLKLGTYDTGSTTNATVLTLGHNLSSGVAGSGMGEAILFNLNSTTTPDVNAGKISCQWVVATHATARSKMDFALVTAGGALTSALTLDGNGVSTFPSSGTVNVGTLGMNNAVTWGDVAVNRSGAGIAEFNAGSSGNWASLKIGNYDTGTTTITDGLTIAHKASGSAPAAGYGESILFNLNSSTTADQNAGRLSYEWVVATHASRTARGKLTAYDTASRECIRFEASGSAPMLGFYGTAAVAQASTGGSASTFASNTSGTVNDTATWDSYTIGQVVKALRNVGILA